jgi:AcrR family transcriptional regulator
VRLSPTDRENMILDAAMDFFTENGFSGQTRDLAKQIGISQALIFRYFGTKELLTEKVYQRVFLSRWSPSWADHLRDRSRPLRQRVKEFYRDYLVAVDDRRWIRIAMYSSLSGRDLTRRWIGRYVEDLLGVIAEEINAEFALPDGSKVDIDFVWVLHSGFIYWLVRKHIHNTGTNILADNLVEAAVDNFLDGLAKRDRKNPAVGEQSSSLRSCKMPNETT